MARAVLLTGSNLGDKAGVLERARREIACRVGPLVAESRVYESEPWGFEAPDSFLNQVLIAETSLEPLELLDELQAIERELGRRREAEPQTGPSVFPGISVPRTYCSRPIDIDILFYDDRIVEVPRLRIPHPLIAQREFVLVPLREVLGDYVHPVLGIPIKDIALPGQESCET